MNAIVKQRHPVFEPAAPLPGELPIDLAVRVLEQALDGAHREQRVLPRHQLHRQAQRFVCPSLGWWIDHLMGQLCTHGYVLRVRNQFGLVGYRPSPSWDRHDEFLRDLRPPRALGSRRARRDGW